MLSGEVTQPNVLRCLSEVAHLAPSLNMFLTQHLRAQNAWSLFDEYPAVYHVNNFSNIWVLLTAQEKIIGSVAGIRREFNSAEPVSVFVLSNLLVDPHFRGKGLSKILVDVVIRKAKIENCDAVILWSDLEIYYRKLNFKPVGDEVLLNWQKALPILDPSRAVTCTVFESGLSFVPPSTHFISPFSAAYNSKIGPRLDRKMIDWKYFLKIPRTFWFHSKSLQDIDFTYGIVGKGADMQSVLHEYKGTWWALFKLINFIEGHFKEGPNKISHWLLSKRDYELFLEWIDTLSGKNKSLVQSWLDHCYMNTRNICMAHELSPSWPVWLRNNPEWHIAGLDSF